MTRETREKLEEMRESLFDVVTQDGTVTIEENEAMWNALESVHTAIRCDDLEGTGDPPVPAE